MSTVMTNEVTTRPFDEKEALVACIAFVATSLSLRTRTNVAGPAHPTACHLLVAASLAVVTYYARMHRSMMR